MFQENILKGILFIGKDVLAKARTGTGKTIAFLVRIYRIQGLSYLRFFKSIDE